MQISREYTHINICIFCTHTSARIYTNNQTQVCVAWPFPQAYTLIHTHMHTHNMYRTPKYMLNPFKIRSPTESKDWSKVYTDLTRPLLLDVGCARGKWIYNLAKGRSVRLELDGKEYNYCGLELVRHTYAFVRIAKWLCFHIYR